MGADDGASFRWPVRVYHEDTDLLGVVYHANYLRFCERARSEWLRAAGLDQRRWLREPGVAFVVRRVHLEFRRPARHDDLLDVGVTVRRAGRASLWLHQPIGRRLDGELLAAAEVQLACVDVGNLRPRPLPQALQEMVRG